MVKKSNVKRAKATHSAALHRSRLKVTENGESTAVKKIVLAVIGVAIVLVIVALACIPLFDKERVTKAKLDKMAAEYYEEYIYENLVNGAMTREEIAEVMDKYVVRGFAAVNLRQLLLYDGRKNAEEAEYVKQYCDENETAVKFYPEVPYDKKSYRVEWRHDCDW